MQRNLEKVPFADVSLSLSLCISVSLSMYLCLSLPLDELTLSHTVCLPNNLSWLITPAAFLTVRSFPCMTSIWVCWRWYARIIITEDRSGTTRKPSVTWQLRKPDMTGNYYIQRKQMLKMWEMYTRYRFTSNCLNCLNLSIPYVHTVQFCIGQRSVIFKANKSLFTDETKHYHI